MDEVRLYAGVKPILFASKISYLRGVGLTKFNKVMLYGQNGNLGIASDSLQTSPLSSLVFIVEMHWMQYLGYIG